MAVFTSCKKGEALNPIKLDNQTIGVSTVLHDSIYYVYPTGYREKNAFKQPINLGVPAYLEAQNDEVDNDFLSELFASLPNESSVVLNHPEYLDPANINVINIISTNNIYVTFVLDNTYNKNTLAYYTYRTGNAPTATIGGRKNGAMDSITYIFPNTNSTQAQGGLVTGNKINLGKFNAGTSIAFVLILNGWNGKNINFSNTKYYSQDALNDSSKGGLKRHSVMLYTSLTIVI